MFRCDSRVQAGRAVTAAITSLSFVASTIVMVTSSSHCIINTRGRDADVLIDMLILFLICVVMVLVSMAVHAASPHTDHASPSLQLTDGDLLRCSSYLNPR